MATNLALPGFGDPETYPQDLLLKPSELRIVLALNISRGMLSEELSRVLNVSQKSLAPCISRLLRCGILCYTGESIPTRSGRQAKILAIDPTHLATRFASNNQLEAQQALIDVPPPTLLERAADLISQGICAGLSPETIADQILALARPSRR
jgi:hypothetical protein